MQPDNHGIAVSLTILLALACSLMPLSGDWIVWKPNFLLLVAMAWVFRWPNEFGVIFAASVGLLVDIVMRTSVGHSILLFAFCAAAILLVARWIKYLSLVQRMLLVLLILLLAGLLEAGIYSFYEQPSGIEYLPMRILLSLLVWPLLDRLVAGKHQQRD